MLTFLHAESLLFAFDHTENILQEKDLAIKNGKITAGVCFGTVLRMEGLWAPPYVSSNFALTLRLFGETVRTDTWRWFPFALERIGSVRSVAVESQVLMACRMRTAIMQVRLTNQSDAALTVPVQACVHGGMDYVHFWEFSTAIGTKEGDLTVTPQRLLKNNNDKALIVAASIPFRWFDAGALWQSDVRVEARQSVTLWLSVSLGGDQAALRESEAVMADPETAVADAVCAYETEVQALFSRLPHLHSDNPLLVQFYYRSLVHYLTNKWETHEMVLNPYFSTGGLRGGCVGSYLWDFSGGWQLHALAAPEATRQHIVQFLKIDLTKSFAFNPVDGCAFGPWYPVNQEKIIGLVYYYVRNSGDVGFLHEVIQGKEVWAWSVHHALVKDHPEQPVDLVDYGIDGEHHLELRRGYPYRGIMPDLNGRRYLNYLRAYELSVLAGSPCSALLERAEQLKILLKTHLWNTHERWFDFISAGRRDIRYTVQMFKLFGSPVLDQEQEEGLLTHLNEAEFLSDFGIHSLSKLDPAYDQIDIDNGGGGACTLFAPLIAEKLYQSGHSVPGDDLLQRVLWWGKRVPYWGDSFVANYVDYRQDTPLQCTIGGVAGAQCILFGIFGLAVAPDGQVTLNPHLPSFCRTLSVSGLKIRDKTISITVQGASYTVDTGSQLLHVQLGVPVTI